MIKKCQINGLKKWSNHIGVFGFVFNFRNNNNRTFFVSIKEFITYISTLSKKSINIDDILKMNPIEIKNEKVRVNYKYDIETFLKNTRI